MAWQLEADIQPELIQSLGSLHLLHAFLARLDLVAIVNRHVGVGPSPDEITYGEVFASLVLCRLSAGPHLPMYFVQGWARSVAFEAVTGRSPELLNDDRIGRFLDALFPKVETVKAALALHVVAEFGLDLKHCLWDVTSVLLTGDHPDQDDAPCVRRGYSRSGAPKERQLRMVAVATADGAVPLLHQTCAGNTEDATTVIPAFEALRKATAGQAPDQLLLSGDTKASGAANLLTIAAAQCWCIAPLAAGDRLHRILREQLPGLQPLDYGRRSVGATPRPVIYWGVETKWQVAAKGHTTQWWRLLVIRSAEERGAVRAQRRKQYDRLVQELTTLGAKLAHTFYRDHPERIRPAVQKVQQAARGIGKYLDITFGNPVAGQVAVLTWRLERSSLRHKMQLDGVYGLVNNLLPAEYGLEAALMCWKEQKHLEKRFRNLKGPLAVQPVFLSKPRRIVGLIAVLMTALMAFTLLEREVRRNLPAGETTLTGLLAPRVKSPPTGQSILRACQFLLVRWRPGSEEKTILHWTPLHAQLYRLAGVAIPRAG